jgi:thioredoxin
MRLRLGLVLSAFLLLQMCGCGKSPSTAGSSSYLPSNATASRGNYQQDEVAPPGMVLVNDQTFKSEIAAGKGVALMNVTAAWCRACTRLAPAVEELARECNGSPKVAKMNFDISPDTCEKFNIRVIPCSILFKDGREIARFTGVKTKDEIKQWVNQYAGPRTVAVK